MICSGIHDVTGEEHPKPVHRPDRCRTRRRPPHLAVLLPRLLHPHPLDSYPDLLVGVGEVGC